MKYVFRSFWFTLKECWVGLLLLSFLFAILLWVVPFAVLQTLFPTVSIWLMAPGSLGLSYVICFLLLCLTEPLINCLRVARISKKHKLDFKRVAYAILIKRWEDCDFEIGDVTSRLEKLKFD